MITPTTMYWLTRLDGIGCALSIICTITIILSIAFAVAGCILRSKEKEYSWQTQEGVDAAQATGRRLHGYATKLVVMSCAFILTNVLIPTTKEMAAILIVPKVANSEKVQEIGGRLYDLAVEWMEELRPAKKEGGVE